MNCISRRFALILSAGFVVLLAATLCVRSATILTKAQAGADSHQDLRPKVAVQPLLDWLTKTKELSAHDMIDLKSDIEFAVDANRDADCRLSHVVIVEKSGDSRLIGLVTDLFASISDSGLPSYLGDQEQTAEARCLSLPLRFNLKSSANEFVASVEFPANNSYDAAKLARAYNLLIAAGRANRRGRANEFILNALNTTSEDKQVVVHFQTSRTNLDDLLRQSLSH